MRATGKAWLAVALTVVLFAMPLAGCTTASSTDDGQDGAASGEPYKIGAVVSLSGTYAGLGGPEEQAIEMEVERINAAGGVHGRPIEVMIEDDATEDAQAVAATGKLLAEDVFAIIGATGTGQTMAMRTEIQQAGVPQVSMAGGTVITQMFDPLVFQTPWSNTLVVPYLLEHMQTQGISKIAVISDTGGFGKDGVAVTEANVGQYGMEIVSSQTFNPGDTDMTTQVTAMKGSGADAFLVWSAGKEAAIVLKNAEQLQVDVPIFGTHGNARKELIEGAGTAAEGFVFPAGKVLIPEAYGEGTEGYEVATGFVKRFEEEYGAAPSTFAGHAYDALYLIVEAMNRVPQETLDGDIAAARQAVRDEIEKTNGFVGIGGTFTFSATDHNGLTPDDLVMYKVENGEWTLVE